MDEATKQSLLSGLRSLLIVAGTALTAKGYTSSETVNTVVGAVMTILPIIWGVVDKVLSEAKTKVREATALNAGIKFADSTVGPTPPVPAVLAPTVIARSEELVVPNSLLKDPSPAPVAPLRVADLAPPAPPVAPARSNPGTTGDRFKEFVTRLLSIEGGYTDGAGDPGGETKWGISKRSYPSVDIKNLTREQAETIYLTDFWVRGRMAELDPAIAYQTFDFAVNSGIETAIRKLQRAVGVADDGVIGPVTIAQIKSHSVSDVIMLFVAERLDFWTLLGNWPVAGRGWTRRAAKDLRYGAQDSD